MKIETHFTEDLNAKTLAYFAKQDDLSISMGMLDEMVEHAQGKNCRLCLHQSPANSFHQMLILEYRGKSFPAHKHIGKSEGYHLIRGEMSLLLYTDEGHKKTPIALNADNPIARVGPNTFHRLIVTSDYAIYHETKPGPFVRDSDKIMAPWTYCSVCKGDHDGNLMPSNGAWVGVDCYSPKQKLESIPVIVKTAHQ